MPFFDMPERELRIYRPERGEPADFDDFWRASLTEARSFPLDPRFEPYECGLATVDVYDATFRGWNGEPVRAWFIIPARREGRLPCVVEYIGYGGGRGYPHDWLVFASAGFAHMIMDTRGQGSTWLHGDTPDPEPADSNPHHPGFMTRGVLDPKTYYYRRVFVDAVRAVEAARSFDSVDPKRVAVRGVSQGGGISLAAAGLDPTLDAVIANVPFLCHYRRAVELVDTAPYVEITRYLKVHRDYEDRVFGTLAYFDGVNFAARARASALFSVGIMDDICPPSTVFAAYNHYTGPKDIKVWRYNMHDGGGSFQVMEELKFLHKRWGV